MYDIAKFLCLVNISIGHARELNFDSKDVCDAGADLGFFPREGRLVQRGGIFRVGGRCGLTWAPYPYSISYLYTYEYAISRNINSIDLR